MQNRKPNSVRSILAAAGLVAGAHLVATPAMAQTVATPVNSRSTDAADAIQQAAALLDQGKIVQARSQLVALTQGASLATLSDSQHSRVFTLLNAANRRLKGLSSTEVSLQNAEACLEKGELKALEAHAQAVIAAPKATNEQSARARDLIARAQASRAAMQPQASGLFANAAAAYDAGDYAQTKTTLNTIQSAGLTLSDEQSEKLARLQNALVEMEQNNASMGMMQPGVVRKREDNQPAPAQPAPAAEPAPQPVEPAAQPAAAEPAQPAAEPAAQPVDPQPVDPQDDIIAQSRRFEAQALLAEADLAFSEARMNEAFSKYSRVLRDYNDIMDEAQRQVATERSAEARARIGSGGNILERTVQENRIEKQRIVAEFANDVEQARAALAGGNTESARDLAASARLRINSGRQYLSESEFQGYSTQVTELLTQIDSRAGEIRVAQQAKTEADLRVQADTMARSANQERQRRINEALERVRALQKEMKFEEALQVVDQILFLDPANPTGLVLRDVIADTIIYVRHGQIQRAKPLSYANQQIENDEALIAPENILDYPSDWPRISQDRSQPIAFAEAEENRRALALLQSKRIPASFNDTPISSVVGFLATITQLNVDVDWQSLEAIGIDRETPVTLNLTNVTVKTVLDRVVEKVSNDLSNGAAWAVNDGVLTIASREVINKNKSLVIYDIRDLLIEVPDYANAPELDLQQVLQNTGQGGTSQSPFEEANEEDDANRRTLEERTQDILNIITTTVDPDGWRENGGDVGFIQQLSGNLIITNTPANHRAIDGLLSKLREVRAMQINVETRFLLVSQDYFEQIGFDLDVYFNANNNQVRQLRRTRPNTRASDFFNFGQGGLQNNVPAPAGSPAGTVGAAIPNPSNLSPIGAGSNSLGLTEGLSDSSFAGDVLANAPALGIAGQFLDDVQVDFLIKATQADRRTVSLTAPRLTFTNGQTSNIYVATQTAFVSDLEPILADSAVGFDPTLATVNEGVRMLVEGTISADRRYVTLNIDASVAAVEGFAQSAVTAIAGGQLVNSAATQSFIQLPTVTVTRVQTTVTVPDQGTILLGGQRVVTESEVETGVPVLSKIPILNRFFSNRITSKEEQTLLILLKPTILIQNEEEERNFPGLEEARRLPFGG